MASYITNLVAHVPLVVYIISISPAHPLMYVEKKRTEPVGLSAQSARLRYIASDNLGVEVESWRERRHASESYGSRL